MLEVQGEDYVRTAEAKGSDQHRRSAAGTCCATRCCRSITVTGLQTGALLAGAVLTETVFAYPGYRARR